MKPALVLRSEEPIGIDRDPRSAVGQGGQAGTADRPLGLLIALLAWQIVWLLALLREQIELEFYASIHVAVSFGLAGSMLWHASPPDGDDTTPLQVVAWSALAGPFGTFVAAALLLRPVLVGSHASPANHDNPTADPRERMERVHVALLDRRIRLDNTSCVRSLVDVMAEGSQPEKLEVLGVVYRNYAADLGPVLRQALQDPDAAVRVLAATVAAKLHGTFTRAIGDRQAAVDASPELAHHWRALAEARLAYAASELLDPVRARGEVNAAVVALFGAAAIDPHNRDTVGRFDRARRQLAASRS